MTLSHSAVAGWCSAEYFRALRDRFNRTLAPIPAAEGRALVEWIAMPDSTVDRLMGYLSRYPVLDILYGSKNLGTETIREHTKKVGKNLMEALPQYDFSGYKIPAGVNTVAVLKAAIALHDIGKPLLRDLQHVYSPLILAEAMAKVGFTAPEIALARVLVGQDRLGRFIQSGETDLKAIQAHLASDAALAGLNNQDYFRLLTLYYSCDVRAYAILSGVVQPREGKWLPRSAAYQALADAIAAGPEHGPLLPPPPPAIAGPVEGWETFPDIGAPRPPSK